MPLSGHADERSLAEHLDAIGVRPGTYHRDGAHLDDAFVIDQKGGSSSTRAQPRYVARPPLGVRARVLLLGLSPRLCLDTEAGRRAGESRQEARL